MQKHELFIYLDLNSLWIYISFLYTCCMICIQKLRWSDWFGKLTTPQAICSWQRLFCSVLFCSVLSCPVLPCPVLLGSIVILLYSLHTLFYTYIHIVCICMLYVGMYMRFCRFGLRQSRQRRRNFSFQQDRSIIKYVSKWVTIAGWFVHFLNFKQKGKNYVPM